MSDLIPFAFKGTRVRIVTIDGQPWFVAADVTFILGYSNGRDAVAKHVRDHQRADVAIHDGSQNRQMTVISEGGLYRLMLRANTVLADEFQDWVTDEVLPTIRSTGGYSIQHQIPATFAEALELAARQAREIEAANTKVAELEPAANSWTQLADAGGDYSLRDAAQILKRSGVDTGQNRLGRYLREIRWTDRSGQPYQTQVDNGRLVRRATGGYDNSSGDHVATWQLRVTPKGVAELHRRLGGGAPLLLAV